MGVGALSTTCQRLSDAKAVEDLFGVNGFEEDLEVVAADPGIAQEVGRGGLTREEQDAASGDHAGNLNGGFDPAHPRHDDVREKDVGMKMARGFNGFLTAVDSGGFEAILGENHSQGIGDDSFVVGDEDSGPDPAVGGASIHETFGRNSRLQLGTVQRVYRPGLESMNYF